LTRCGGAVIDHLRRLADSLWQHHRFAARPRALAADWGNDRFNAPTPRQHFVPAGVVACFAVAGTSAEPLLATLQTTLANQFWRWSGVSFDALGLC
jgi:hypothetical protein